MSTAQGQQTEAGPFWSTVDWAVSQALPAPSPTLGFVPTTLPRGGRLGWRGRGHRAGPGLGEQRQSPWLGGEPSEKHLRPEAEGGRCWDGGGRVRPCRRDSWPVRVASVSTRLHQAAHWYIILSVAATRGLERTLACVCEQWPGMWLSRGHSLRAVASRKSLLVPHTDYIRN